MAASSDRIGIRLLVTGAASGIGRAVATSMARRGARLALADVDWSHWENPEGQCSTMGAAATNVLSCDVADEDIVSETVARTAAGLGGLDAVVHAAGIIGSPGVPVDLLDLDEWHRVVTTNLTGAFLVAKHTVPLLEQSEGVLVLVGSGAGVWNGHSSLPYAASKGGLHGLAISLEAPLRRRGIRVHDVAPGAVDTPLARSEVGDQRIDEGIASGRIVSAEAVAQGISAILSSDAGVFRGTIRTW